MNFVLNPLSKNKKEFDFNKQLAIGEKGENFFIKCYEFINARKVDVHAFDILIYKDVKVELKTDTYSMDNSPNFFMEKYGDIEEKIKSLGGPWRAKKDQIDFFVYLYIKDRMFFWFEPIPLCEYLNPRMKKFELRYIKNKDWTAIGFLVKRDEINHLCYRQEKFDSNGQLLATIR